MTDSPRATGHKSSPYEHADAFKVMTYRSDDGTEEETVWNSRDGVTSYVITLRSGKHARHVDWHNDRCDNGYQPPPGSRLFVDLTLERARVIAEQAVDRYLSDPAWKPTMLAEYGTRERAIEALTEDYLRRPGSPDLIEVPAGPTAGDPAQPTRGGASDPAEDLAAVRRIIDRARP